MRKPRGNDHNHANTTKRHANTNKHTHTHTLTFPMRIGLRALAINTRLIPGRKGDGERKLVKGGGGATEVARWVFCLLVFTVNKSQESRISIGIDGGYSNVVIKMSYNVKQNQCATILRNVKVRIHNKKQVN